MPAQHVLTIFATADLPRARAFYARAFGWPIAVDVPVYTEFSLPGGQRFGLYDRHAYAHNTGLLPDEVQPGGVSTAELYLHVDDVDAALAALLGAGARLLSPPALRPWGDLAAYTADPDGHVLAVARPGAV